MTAYGEAAEFLGSEGTLLLSTHVNADGDGIGALLALGEMLDRMGRPFRIVLSDDTPDRKLDFLAGFDRIETFGSLTDSSSFRRAVFADTPTITERRVGKVASLVSEDTSCLIIDHHVADAKVNAVRLVDQEASAASEVVFRLLQHMEVGITPSMATHLYAGIAFDTKLFKFSQPGRAIKACAELVVLGADPQVIADGLFARERFETVKTLGVALASVERHFDGRVNTLAIDNETYSLGGDLDLIVDHAMAIDGVEVALFLKEEAPGRFRVSLRSRGEVDVNEVAQTFGGGGHRRASGCTMEMPLEKAKQALLSEVEKVL